MTWSTANCAERALSRRGRALAAIDLGTNNCRLMVAVPRRDGFAVVDTFSRIVRLGEGLAGTGRLSEEAQERTIGALKECAEIIARWEVGALRCVTTEACRSAANGEAFVERVRRETGLRLEVIDADQEARLALSGCAGLIDRNARDVALFDIGGGSTEICFLAVRATRSGRVAHRLTRTLSLPFGVVRLSDGLAPGGFAGEHYRGIRRRVAEAVGAAMPETFLRHRGRTHLIGTSGTATSLAALHKGLKRYRRREVDGSWLHRDEIEDLSRRLESLGLEGRRAVPCIGDGRADLIMPGCAILEGIVDATRTERVRVADRGLREGLITQLLGESRIERRTRAAGGAIQPAE